MTRHLLFLLFAFVALLFPQQEAKAQDVLVVAVCGTLPLAYSPGATRLQTVDVNGKLCTSGGNGSLVIGTTPITGGATTQVLFNLAGVVSSSSGFVSDSSGNVTVNSLVSSVGNATVGTGSLFAWTGRGGIGSSGDGIFRMSTNSGSTFGRLIWGPATSSFPALKTNGPVLEFKLGDDSAYTSFTATTGILNAITTDSGQTATATVCEDTTTHQLYFGSGTGGICKGTSGRQFKRDITGIADLGLANVLALEPKRYFNKAGVGLDSTRPQVGFIADEVRAVIPDCADDNTVDYLCLSVVSVNAIKALNAEIEKLKRRVN